ncbi:MAG TPA: PhzF family phenazine biosynthesis protein, partial [Ktedonobacterales bacterium]|nr:PhzF family phenazine biosynthesis protein [Ktedonobacterales bacterium]
MRELLQGLEYRHVDVFTREALSGNGLIVFPEGAGLAPESMQLITREMRQFESIFLVPTPADAHRVQARVFTMEEELPFAGHPVLGAACVLHERLYYVGDADERAEWTLELPVGPVQVSTTRREGWYEATMNQGQPRFGATPDAGMVGQMLAALNLEEGDLYPGLPMEVISTGLPYLLVPLADGLEHAAIVQPGFETLLASVGAKFVYVLHVATREGRTWDNDGRVEDVATGSAAGPTGAYLVQHGLASPNEEITLRQGRFLGRPSEMRIRVEGATGDAGEIAAVYVTGDVR